MKKVIGIVVGALLSSLAATAFAADSQQRLSRLGAGDGNIALIYPVSGNWGGSLCTNKTAIVIDLSNEGGRQAYHTALAAYLAGLQVKAFWNGCHAGTGHPQATRVDVMPN